MLKKFSGKKFPEWVKESSKPFIPHITVKRWQRYEFNDLKQGLLERNFESLKFEVTSLDLFISEKDSSDNKYHVIFRKNLNI
jgi:2'-5' RNA ligase